MEAAAWSMAADSEETEQGSLRRQLAAGGVETGTESPSWPAVGTADSRAPEKPADAKKQRLSHASFAQHLAEKSAVSSLSEAVTNLIQNHHDVTNIVNVKRFTRKICEALFAFTGTARILSLKDLNKILGVHPMQTVWLYTIDRKGCDQWIKKKIISMDDFPAYGFEDPLLNEIQKQEVELAVERTDGLIDERTWFSARKQNQMQYHAARTITAACANRFHLTTFLFLTTAEYTTATKRIHSQFGCTQVLVVEFLVGCNGMLSPANFTSFLADPEIKKETDSSTKRALSAALQASGIVIVLCETEVVRNLDRMLRELLEERNSFEGAICFGYCVVVPFREFNNSQLQILMDERFIDVSSNKTCSGAVPHLVIDLAQDRSGDWAS
jgi:hypothetical protein